MASSRIEVEIAPKFSDEWERLQVLHFKKGDTLVFTIKDERISSRFRDLVDRLNEKFPDNKIVVLANGIELSAVADGAEA